MKKGLSILVALAFLLSSFAVGNNAYAATEKEEVLYNVEKIKEDKELLKTKYKDIKVDGKIFKEPKVEVESFLEKENIGLKVKNENSNKQATQLLKVTKKGKDEYTAEYVTVAEVTFDENSISPLAAAESGTTQEEWVTGARGYVTVYYHIQLKEDFEDSFDMNYIKVSWAPSSGYSVERRSATMYDVGKSHWDDHWEDASLTVYPTTNSSTQYDVPDAWLPIWQGQLGAKSKAYVTKDTVNYVTLNVDCQILP